MTCRNTGASGPRRVFYPLHVPDGHLLNYVDIWGWDNSARELSFRVLKVCQAFLGGGLPVVTELATGATAGTPQRFHAEINIDPDDESTPGICGHVVEARFTADGLSCAGPDLGVLRVRAEVRNPDVIYRDGFFLPRQILLTDEQQSGDE